MATTFAIPRSLPSGPSRSTPSHTITPTLSLDSINTSAACPLPIPNKHLPVCPPGPAPSEEPDTPPQSPPTKETSPHPHSLLYPPSNYRSRSLDTYTVYEIDATGIAAALDHVSRQLLPDPSHVFPWLHGLHPNNHIQQAFFIARRRNLRKTPKCWRGITLVKAGGDLSCSRLKGAIAPEEFLSQEGRGAVFKEVDPKEGFSVRNFQIQAAKSSMVSDVIVYGDSTAEVHKLARDIAVAQRTWREAHAAKNHEVLQYNTFVCTSPFVAFEERYPLLVATDARGCMTGAILDFFHQERLEMCAMTKASEIHHNVWLGPTLDPTGESSLLGDDYNFDICIDCNDLGRLSPGSLQEALEHPEMEETLHLEFPSSGSIMPPSWSQSEADAILETCIYIYNLANGASIPAAKGKLEDERDNSVAFSAATPKPSRERRILIHCTDGYTESTLLGLAYYIFATGLPVPAAWLDLHVSRGRNFFAYPSDVALLTTIAPRLLSESPAHSENQLLTITELAREEPDWIRNIDGSLPSRITKYMYLGNLGHANNPDLLRRIGITQILSVGETAAWKDEDLERWGNENVMVVQRVQDNGVDPLTEEFERCLEFIERGRLHGTATLVHCRVGVSRSATICIAEVMRSMKLSFPRAYCFVRARRLNVIIQPHLRFSYELLKWEEKLGRACEGHGGYKRELEWPEIAREIAAMNKPYAR